MKKYETFEHGADLGIRGIGNTLEEAFINAAKALFSIMVVNLEEVLPKEGCKIWAQGENIEELFLDWINSLLTQAGLRNLIFSEFDCRIETQEGEFLLEGWAAGEPLDERRHEVGCEVKGATYTLLKVEKKDDLWLAQCVVDV